MLLKLEPDINVIGTADDGAAAIHMVEKEKPALVLSGHTQGVNSVDWSPDETKLATASLDGTVSPTLLGGYRPLGNTLFPGVLTATGGITGTFSTILNQQISPTLFLQPRYSATSFDLFVQRDYANQTLSLNSNQLAVGTMLNSVASATSGDLNLSLAMRMRRKRQASLCLNKSGFLS